jgi:hypothetical protein
VVVRGHTRDGRLIAVEEVGNYFDDASGTREFSRTDLTEDELRQKFRDNVGCARSAERADVLLDCIDALDGLGSVHELTELLH